MKKIIDYTPEELNYIESNLDDRSANVFYVPVLGTNGRAYSYKVYAKPFEDSKSSFKFPIKNENDAQKFVMALMDESIGYTFEVRGKRVLAKPTTRKATLICRYDRLETTQKMVHYLRAQEVSNRRTAENRKEQMKGTRLIRQMIAPSLEELNESLYDAMEDSLETNGNISLNGKTYQDLSSAKIAIAQNDFQKEVATASQKLCDTLNNIN